MVISQQPVENWHGIVGYTLIADVNMDRPAFCSRQIEITGDTVRKKRYAVEYRELGHPKSPQARISFLHTPVRFQPESLSEITGVHTNRRTPGRKPIKHISET